MNRRTVLALGGTVVTVTGGTIAADALRADIFVDSDLHRGQGESVSIEMAADSVNKEEKTDGIEENEGTESRANQASKASREIARNRVVKTVNERLDAEIEGVTSSISHLIFGPVITLNHIVSHERDGSVISEPNISMEKLVSVVPRTLSITIKFDGDDYTNKFPVCAEHIESYDL